MVKAIPWRCRLTRHHEHTHSGTVFDISVTIMDGLKTLLTLLPLTKPSTMAYCHGEPDAGSQTVGARSHGIPRPCIDAVLMVFPDQVILRNSERELQFQEVHLGLC